MFTAAEAQLYLTRIHPCGCQEFWFMEPPGRLRCELHTIHAGGPTDDAVMPERRAEAMASLAAADLEETARRAAETEPKETRGG